MPDIKHTYFVRVSAIQSAMSDIYKLKTGESYRVIKEFTDYDGNLHKAGERWIFVRIDYLPYHSGLSLNVIENGESIIYRFQDEPDQQQLLECFMDYVAEKQFQAETRL